MFSLYRWENQGLIPIKIRNKPWVLAIVIIVLYTLLDDLVNVLRHVAKIPVNRRRHEPEMVITLLEGKSIDNVIIDLGNSKE